MYKDIVVKIKNMYLHIYIFFLPLLLIIIEVMLSSVA